MNFEDENQRYDKYGSFESWDVYVKTQDFTIKWKDLGHNNYEVYVMWGGPMRN